jgi:membrane-bound lytic murein transglycosylase D
VDHLQRCAGLKRIEVGSMRTCRKIDELAERHPYRWLCKEAKFKACDARGVRRASGTPQRQRTEAQRRNWAVHKAIKIAFSAALVVAVMAASAGAQSVPAGPPLDFTPLIEAARVRGPLDFCGEPVPLEDPDVRERMEREMLLVLWDAPQVILWIKRSGQYLAPIEEALRARNLPQDLKYIAVAESALRPHAGSAKGAMGFWQFVTPTGRKYGLTIDSQKDERRNLVAATEAALVYLQGLRETFGSWTLAAAAYNMGENGLRKEIAAQASDDYYRLYLSLETQRYVFRILAAKTILSDPDRYGFHLRPDDIFPARPSEPIVLDLARETPVLAVAQAANTSVKVIKDLNPEIRGFQLAPGPHPILVPAGSASGLIERLAQLTPPANAEGEVIVVYVVKAADTLTAIAGRFNVSVTDIAGWNRLDAQKPIHPGQRLAIHAKAGGTSEDPQP